MTIQWLFGWWNLVFIAPFFLALVYLGIYAASGVTFGDVDHDVDLSADADVDHDLDADADVDHDLDADHDLDSDADGDADGDHDADDAEHSTGSSLAAALTWLGVGRVPLSIVLTVMFLSWGFIGFASNQLLRERFADPNRFAIISIAIALIGSALCARVVSSSVAKYLPTNETYAQARHELLGAIGEVVLNVDENFGMVAVRDERGQFMQIPARTRAGAEAIAKGMKVRLVAYTAKDRYFHVVPASAEQGATLLKTN